MASAANLRMQGVMTAAAAPTEEEFSGWVEKLSTSLKPIPARLPSPRSYRYFLGRQPELFPHLVDQFLTEVEGRSNPLWAMYCRGYFLRSAKFYMANSQRIFGSFCKTFFPGVVPLTIAYSLQLTDLLEEFPGLMRIPEVHPCLTQELPLCLMRTGTLAKKHAGLLNAPECVDHFPIGFRQERSQLPRITPSLDVPSPAGWGDGPPFARGDGAAKRRRSSSGPGGGFRPIDKQHD